MAIRVLMKRPVSAGEKEDLRVLTDRLRVLAMGQDGYISGETLIRIDQPGVSLVISKWKSLSAWERWFRMPERESVQQQIDELIGTATEYEIYDFD
jgi:heme-degrading monooxygenase HmoA